MNEIDEIKKREDKRTKHNLREKSPIHQNSLTEGWFSLYMYKK